jgi:hypothetical protein
MMSAGFAMGTIRWRPKRFPPIPWPRRGCQSRRLDQWFVSLHVDENLFALRWACCGNFGHAFGAGAVLGARHDRFGPEIARRLHDALVVGSDDYSGYALCAASSAPKPLDHGFAGKRDQRLARQAGGGITSGNNGDGHKDLFECARTSVRLNLECYHMRNRNTPRERTQASVAVQTFSK